MRIRRLRYIPLALALAARLPAAGQNPSDTGKAAADPVSQQRQAVSAMEQSLEMQRQALRKQTEPWKSQPFFLLPPPQRTALVPAPAPECEALPAADVDSLIGQAARHEELDADLLRSVMQQESGFRPCAVSPKGAMGLMQLMPATAAQLGVEDPFNPQQNVDAGARFLKQLLDSYSGDVPRALAAYNAGPAKVNAVGGIPFIPETLDYIRKVMQLLPPLP
jgi:soluble lytic murein transglycosylase-like protein